MPEPSLRDQMEFEALPEEVQLLARRVLIGGVQGDPSTIQAYLAGYEDGVEDCDIERPSAPHPDIVSKRLTDLAKSKLAKAS